MAYYNTKTNETERNKPVKIKNGWYRIDCGCCNGITWNHGFECNDCRGNGFYYWHKKSKVKAVCIGGPLLGKANIKIKAEKAKE